MRKGIMLAYPLEEKRLKKWTPPYIVQPKYDGERCRAIVRGSNVILLSSQENIIFSVPHINRALSNCGFDSIELDGELYCHGMSFEEIVSIVSRTKNLHPEAERISYHIFDIVNETNQGTRLIDLSNYYLPGPYLQKAPFWLRSTLEGVMNLYEYLTSNEGYEGIIVRHINSYYIRKRSTYMMKFKPKKSDVYTIKGFQEEVSIHGSPKERLGSLLLTDDDGREFSVGSGFTADERESLWWKKDSLIGKKVEVKYQHTTERGVPRFPIFFDIED